MNEIVQFEARTRLTAVEIRANVNLVQEVMQAVMKKDVHYGTIPGTPKPTLYKPGAEVLAATFRIAVSYQVEDLSTPDVVRYRVTAIGTHQTSGTVMGSGMGECSSAEEKYKWRKAASAKEFEATPEDRKRVKYGKEWSTNQVRTEAADLANTVLKMACKRAQVAMTLNVTAASDIFTQDIEDLPEELRHNDAGEPVVVPQPKKKAQEASAPAPNAEAPKVADDVPADGPALSQAQLSIIKKRMEGAALTELDLKGKFQRGLEAFKAAEFNKLMEWIKNPMEA